MTVLFPDIYPLRTLMYRLNLWRAEERRAFCIFCVIRSVAADTILQKGNDYT
jgi:hypothetical protein